MFNIAADADADAVVVVVEGALSRSKVAGAKEVIVIGTPIESARFAVEPGAPMAEEPPRAE